MIENGINPDQKFQFFVYMVESPSASDFYHDRSEGSLISKALSLDSIPCVLRTVVNSETFEAALKAGLIEAMTAHPERLPIIHISAHGDREGLQLTNGQEISWHQFRKLLMPICQSLNGFLLLCMSACTGFAACQMAMEVGNVPHPYYGLVGSTGMPSWSDTAISYLAFYHLFAQGVNIDDAIEVMNAVSNDKTWIAKTAEETRIDFIKLVTQEVQLTLARQSLEGLEDETDEITPE